MKLWSLGSMHNATLHGLNLTSYPVADIYDDFEPNVTCGLWDRVTYGSQFSQSYFVCLFLINCQWFFFFFSELTIATLFLLNLDFISLIATLFCDIVSHNHYFITHNFGNFFSWLQFFLVIVTVSHNCNFISSEFWFYFSYLTLFLTFATFFLTVMILCITVVTLFLTIMTFLVIVNVSHINSKLISPTFLFYFLHLWLYFWQAWLFIWQM